MDKSISIVPYKLTWKGKIIAITSEDSMINLHNCLNKVRFRENVNMDSAKKCKWCDYHQVQLLDPSDPDNSERIFYCNYCSFVFQGTKSALDLTQFVCDQYTSKATDGLWTAFKKK